MRTVEVILPHSMIKGLHDGAYLMLAAWPQAFQRCHGCVIDFAPCLAMNKPPLARGAPLLRGDLISRCLPPGWTWGAQSTTRGSPPPCSASADTHAMEGMIGVSILSTLI